jgi:general secretion pathway protein G
MMRRINSGFTLIELLVVLTIVALLLTVAVPRYLSSVDRSKENVLRANLAITRDALDKYYGDNGRYPDSLEQLVEKRYLRTLPLDPITESSNTWAIQAPQHAEIGGVVSDLHSGAPGTASDGSRYSDW